MKVRDIIDDERLLGFEDEVNAVCKDSRLVKPGDIFFNLKNSEAHAREVLNRGAVIVVGKDTFGLSRSLEVKDVRESFGKACANFYDNPAKKLKFIGITGTNGKTTCAHIISELLKYSGKKVATVGTMGVSYNGNVRDYSMTTPDADILQREFAGMVKSGVEYVVMEVSAHALDQKRVEGIHFDVGVLTNITQDHLDYFHTMENYKNTKLKFFSPRYIKSAVVCSDDESGLMLMKNCPVPAIFYGIRNPSEVFAVNIQESLNGMSFFCNALDNVVKVSTNLVGEYNVLNVLASLSVGVELGLNLEDMVKSLKFINPVEGRFNVINYQNKHIIIDFAHTPDGLKNVLETAKSLCHGRLFCVFGCGGNRDRDKRHKMGEIAEKYCDYVCLTNDNPRLEDEKEIVKDIEKGLKKSHLVEFDRYEAIRKIMSLAKADDVLVIAGKGGEKYQIIGTEKRDYNDFDAVYKVIQQNKIKVKEEYGD